MYNIFGKKLHDYKYLNAMPEQQRIQHLQACEMQGRPHRFDNSPGLSKVQQVWNAPGQASGYRWLESNLEAIQAEVEETLYAAYKLPNLVPLKKNIDRGADSYSFAVQSAFGEAGFIDNNGTNVQNITISYGKISTPLGYGGACPSWNHRDIDSAMTMGRPLVSDTIRKATLSCLKHMENLALTGTGAAGFECGLINANSALLPEPDRVAVKDDLGKLKDNANLLDTMHEAIRFMLDQSKGIAEERLTTGLTVYLPPAQHDLLSSVTKDSKLDHSRMSLLAKYNPWTAETGNDLQFRKLYELKNAGGNNDKDRMLIAFNHPSVMEMGVAIEPEVMSVQNLGYAVIAPMQYSVSALRFKLPKGAMYFDGI